MRHISHAIVSSIKRRAIGEQRMRLSGPTIIRQWPKFRVRDPYLIVVDAIGQRARAACAD